MKLLFYFENKWVFGKIHNELIKVLHPDIYCDILDASVEIMSDKMMLFLNKYDYIVTTPWAGITVLHKKGGIPLDRIIAIAHGDLDISAATRDGATSQDFDRLAGYAVISNTISKFSKKKKIKRVPHILRVGVFTDLYNKEVPAEINTIGYVGSYSRLEDDIDIKRGYIAKKIADKLGLNFVHVHGINFLTIEQMYKDIDILIFCSLTEGNPYSALEAFASGIPVIGTDVGVFKKLASSGGGFVLPTSENKFIAQACETINLLKKNTSDYVKSCICAKIQSKIYDWSKLRHEWINYFLSLESKK